MHDTAAALDSLTIAKGYYDRLSEQKLTHSEQLDCIKFAAHHLARARAADPTAVLEVETSKGTETYTQEILSASILYIQASIEAAHEDQASWNKALETLKQASAYAPNLPYIHRKIAEVMLKLHRRDEAATAAKFALILNPNDMQSRLLVDKIDTTPTLGVPEEIPGQSTQQTGHFIALAGAVVLIGGPMFFSSIGREDLIFGCVVFGGLGIWAGFKISEFGQRTKYLHNALRKDHYR